MHNSGTRSLSSLFVTMTALRRPPARVLLVDDNALFRDGLRGMIDAELDLVIVGEADSGPKAIALTADRRPDLVVLQAECPGDGVVETVHQLRHLSPEIGIIVLSLYHDPGLLRESLGATVQVHMVKRVTRFTLIAALRSIAWNGDPQAPDTCRLGLSSGSSVDGASVLSHREREVLCLVARGLSNVQIARKLDIVEGTVKRHLRNIFIKLAARSRIEAVNRAVAAAIIPPYSG